MSDRLEIGMELPATFAGGAFGRNYWGPARVEAFGVDWVVVRDESGQVWFSDSPSLVIEAANEEASA